MDIPVIASGGVGNLGHLADGVLQGGADAVLAASIFHFGEFTVAQAKRVAAFAEGSLEVHRCATAHAGLKSVASKRHADQVMRSMTNMGLPSSRVSMSSATSDTAESSEVHIYVR